MKPLADAQREVLDALPALPTVRVGLADALGLVLDKPVFAPHDVPPFANSAMDGYAVRALDVQDVPVELKVVDDVPAGHVASETVKAGTAIKIMTGAPLPAGADTVVKVEDTLGQGPDVVRVLASVRLGTSVRHPGGDVEAGSMVFDAGVRLDPARLGVLATVGVDAPLVRRRPRVAVLSTGDEVQPPSTPDLRPGWIRDANRPLLRGLLQDLGADVVDLGIVPDDAGLLRAALERGSAEADAVFTSGGVSMGEHDLVKQVLTELGGVELWRVAMKPAKPFAFGLIDGTPLFGLPGNPVSVLVAFEQFARPGLLAMMGATYLFRRRVPGVAGQDFRTDPAKTVFLRAAIAMDEGVWVARSAGAQESNVLSAAAAADAFAVVPVGTGEVVEGEPVELELFRAPEARTRAEVLGD